MTELLTESEALVQAVRGLITASGKTQAEVAAGAGINLKRLSRRLNGQGVFDTRDLYLLARELHTTVVRIYLEADALRAGQGQSRGLRMALEGVSRRLAAGGIRQ